MELKDCLVCDPTNMSRLRRFGGRLIRNGAWWLVGGGIKLPTDSLNFFGGQVSRGRTPRGAVEIMLRGETGNVVADTAERQEAVILNRFENGVIAVIPIRHVCRGAPERVRAMNDDKRRHVKAQRDENPLGYFHGRGMSDAGCSILDAGWRVVGGQRYTCFVEAFAIGRR
jgi:hypothetical protein